MSAVRFHAFGGPEVLRIENVAIMSLHVGRPPRTRLMHREAWAGIMGLLAAGALRVVLDRTFALDDVAKAHEYLADRKAHGKVVLLPYSEGPSRPPPMVYWGGRVAPMRHR